VLWLWLVLLFSLLQEKNNMEKPTFGLGTAPIEIVYNQNEGRTKELGSSKYWILGGLVAIAVLGYFIYKRR